MKELKETVGLMLSKDYKDRMVAEYLQVKIRYEKLNAMIEKYKKGELEFIPDCPVPLLEVQAEHMKSYLNVLLVRANLEKIDLKKWEGRK